MIVLKLELSRDGEPASEGERVYDVFGPGARNFEPLGLKIRASKDIVRAEDKLLSCLRRELKGKIF